MELMTQAGKILRDRDGHILVGGAGGGLLALAILVGVVTWNLTPVVLMLVIGAAILIGGIFGVSWGRAHKASADRAERHVLRVQYAREQACPAVTNMVGSHEPDWADILSSTRDIMELEDAQDIGDDLALRLVSLNAAYKQAIRDAGFGDTTDIRREARAAVTAMVSVAKSRRDEHRRMARVRDDERAPEVARRFTKHARAVAGVATLPGTMPPPSASATLQRLIGLSERALAVDADLVDDAGARLDDLVHTHLPRLLDVHASAARAADPASLAVIDAEFANGVEQVRASVDEALARDARNRFDALRTEVAFLKARRLSLPVTGDISHNDQDNPRIMGEE